MLTEVQLTAARLTGRGKIARVVCETLSISERTLRYWKALPGFSDEVERVRRNAWQPDPEGTLLDALTATRQDGVDWNARIMAARLLIEIEARRPPEPSTIHAPGTIHVYHPALPPPDDQPAEEPVEEAVLADD